MLLLIPRPASWGGDPWGCVWAASLHSYVNLNPKLVLVFCKSKGFYHLQLLFFFFSQLDLTKSSPLSHRTPCAFKLVFTEENN